MQLIIFNSQKDLLISKREIKLVVSSVLSFLKIKTDFLTIHFISAKKMRSLHNFFFQDPTDTDTISLPIDSPKDKVYPHVLGESFICPKTASNYVKSLKNNKPDSDLENLIYEETTLYLIHSILHLSGYKDKEPQEQDLMRKKEKAIQKFLKKHNLVIKKYLNK